MDTLEQRRILRLKEVTRLIGISRSSLYSMVAKGGFPRADQNRRSFIGLEISRS